MLFSQVTKLVVKGMAAVDLSSTTVFNTANGEPLRMMDNAHPIVPMKLGMPENFYIKAYLVLHHINDFIILPINANKHDNDIMKPANTYSPFGFTGTLIWNAIIQKIATKTPDKFGSRIVLSCRKYPYNVQIKQLVNRLMNGKEESCPTVLRRRILRATLKRDCKKDLNNI